MQGKGYRYFSYLNLRTGDRYVSVGTSVLIKKLGISKGTLYNWVKADGWLVDEDKAVFWVEKKDVLHNAPKNNNLNPPKDVVSEPSGVVHSDKPSVKKAKPKRNRTDGIGAKKDQKDMGEETGNNGGSQNGDHE